MVWLDEDAEAPVSVSRSMADLVYRLEGATLPVRHGLVLREAVAAVLDWLEEEPATGIHPVHVAATGNGWMRPDDDGDAPLRLSRRTRLAIRLPVERIEPARILEGRTLDVGGHRLRVGESRVRELRACDTLFARYVAHPLDEDEAAFVARTAAELTARGVTVRKLLCGQAHRIESDRGPLPTRSLMVADLAPADSVRLQEEGLGEGRGLGCGLFIHHKSIAPVREGSAE